MNHAPRTPTALPYFKDGWPFCEVQRILIGRLQTGVRVWEKLLKFRRDCRRDRMVADMKPVGEND